MPIEEPTTPPLRLVLSAAGAIISAGRADFVPGAGERVVELPENRVDALRAAVGDLAAGEEITYDEAAGTFGTRVRALSAAEQDEAATRTLVVNAAQTAVGVNLTALTAGQRNALLAILLWKAGALTPTGEIRPLAQWARR